jgi:tetratricopeptide (TPR) repeat protein
LTLESKAARLDDPGARLLDSVNANWNRYGRAVVIGLGVVAVAAIGIFFTLRTRAASEEQAAGRLAEANILFWQGDYNRSLQLARQVAEQWPGTPSGVDARRMAGDDQFWTGNFKEASAEYRRYLDRQKTGLIAEAVRRSLAYALESEHQYKDAVPLYEGLVGKFDRESSAEFLLGASRCYRLTNQPKEADQRIQRLLDEYGETSYATRARIMRAEMAGAPR